jgi:peptidylprolyl isomerase
MMYMSRVDYGDTVSIHVTQKLEDGTEIGSTIGRDPLKATAGDEETIPGLEDAVIGMKPGDRRLKKISSLYFVGPYSKNLVLEIDPHNLPPNVQPRVGMELSLKKGRNKSTRVRITDISEDSLTIDANHPLAGKNLVLDIQLLDIL